MKKLLYILLLPILVLSTLSCSNSEVEPPTLRISSTENWQGLRFTVSHGNNRYATLESNYSSTIKPDIIIPTYVDNAPLRYIAPNALENLSIESVNFKYARNLRTINNGAFRNNIIEQINFDGAYNLELIGNSSFSNNDITTINFDGAHNLELIGHSAFINNDIRDLNISNLAVLTYIYVNAFANNRITTLTLKDLDNPKFTLEANAFNNNDLNTVTLQNISGLICLNLTTFGIADINHFKLYNISNLKLENVIQNTNITTKYLAIFGYTFLDYDFDDEEYFELLRDLFNAENIGFTTDCFY